MRHNESRRPRINVRAIILLLVVAVILYFVFRIPVRNLYRALTGGESATQPAPTSTVTSAPAPSETPFKTPATKPPDTSTPLQLPSPQ